ncbi:MAG: hypothetical protein AB8E82_10325 [Aureispira sp.]
MIDLNALAKNYYQKVSTQISLLKDIKVGDKVSFAYAYNDCPSYQNTFFITLLALNNTEFKILNQSNRKHKKRPTLVKLTTLQHLEEKVRELPLGNGLEIQIRKNNHYQVFKHYQPPYKALSMLIKEFQALHQQTNSNH